MNDSLVSFLVLTACGFCLGAILWIPETAVLKIAAKIFWQHNLYSIHSAWRRFATALKVTTRLPLCSSLSLLYLEKNLPLSVTLTAVLPIFFLRQAFSIFSAQAIQTVTSWKRETGLWCSHQPIPGEILSALSLNSIAKLSPIYRECLALYLIFAYLVVWPIGEVRLELGFSHLGEPDSNMLLIAFANSALFFPYFHSRKIQKEQKLSRAENYWLKHPGHRHSLLLQCFTIRNAIETKGLQTLYAVSSHADMFTSFAILILYS